MAKYSLSQGGSILGGTSSRVRATTIDPSIANKVTSPGVISSQVGSVRNTPNAIPDIQVDKTLDAAADAANRIVTAAFQYQERVDQLEADQAVLDYRAQSRALFFGKDKGDGTYEGGFGSLERESALKAFNGYREGVESLANNALEGRSESVKAKMILRIQQEKEAANDRGVQHNYQQLKLHEQNVRFQEKQDILKDIELNGPAAFTNGTIETHLNRYTNLEERNAAQEYLAQNALFMTYNDAIEAASADTGDLTPAVTAYRSVESAFNSIRNTLPEDIENSLQNWMQGKANHAQAQAKAAIKERETRRRNEIERSAPMNFAQAMVDSDMDLLNMSIAGYASTQKDTESGRNKVVGALKDAMALAVDRQGGVSLSDKAQNAFTLFSQIQSNNTVLDPVELMELEQYALVDLPKKIESRMAYQDMSYLSRRGVELAKAVAAGEQIPIDENPPPGMTPKYAEMYYKQNEQYKNKFKGKVSGVQVDKAEDQIRAYRAKLLVAPLTASELGKLQQMEVDNLAPIGTTAKFKKLSDSISDTSVGKEPWKKTSAWKTGQARIKSSDFMFGGLRPVKPKAGASDEELLAYEKKLSDWETKVAGSASAAQLEMDEAAQRAYRAGKDFDFDEWWTTYLKSSVTNGLVITPEMSTPWYAKPFQRSTYRSQVLYEITGNPSDLPSSLDTGE